MNERSQLFPLKSDIERGIISLNCASSSSSTLNTSVNSIDSFSALDEIADLQPSLHEDKKSCCESLCKNWLMFDYDLTKSEYRKINNLRKECLLLFEDYNENHEKLLKDFFDTFLEATGSSKNEKTNINWRTLGFQSDNPRTDFRAAGFYSVKFMHYFAWKHSDELLEMVQLDYFLFAIVAIRLTYLFKLFINLVKDEELNTALKTYRMIGCTRRQFKNFCCYLAFNENFLLILLSKALIFVKEKFKAQFLAEKKELNFLLIDPLLKKATRSLGKILEYKINSDDLEILVDKFLKEEKSLSE